MSVALGDHGDDVEAVQQGLLAHGYGGIGGVDGHFGPKTDAGVRYFQAVNDLGVDGIVGPATASALGVHLVGHHTGGAGDHATGTNVAAGQDTSSEARAEMDSTSASGAPPTSTGQLTPPE